MEPFFLMYFVESALWQDFALLLTVCLLLTALGITVTTSVARVISLYRVQSVLLAAVTGSTALQKFFEVQPNTPGASIAVILVMILILPLLLAWLAGPALRWATETLELPWWPRILEKLRVWGRSSAGPVMGSQVRDDRTSDQDRDRALAAQRHEAVQSWRDASEQAVTVRATDVLAFVAVLAVAALVAQRLRGLDVAETVGLTVSLTLDLLGLYLMVSKRDLISQTVGLLVMDHGLYLAILGIADVPVPLVFFVVALWLYTITILVILLLLVPQVRRRVHTGIDLDGIAAQAKGNGLTG